MAAFPGRPNTVDAAGRRTEGRGVPCCDIFAGLKRRVARQDGVENPMTPKPLRCSVVVPVLLLWLSVSWLPGAGVEIIRDRYGVPHIFADTEEGVCFGSGYAQAEDRLEQLLRNYRKAEGRLAEVFGGEENFQHDLSQRMARHAEVSRQNYSKLSRRVRACLEAYQEGIRTYMKEHPEEVPWWAPELHPWQVVALGRYIIWGWPLGEALGDLRRGGIDVTPPRFFASNQWLVAPGRTSLGAVVALIDPHLSWYDHFRFYECRLYGGELQLSGMAILGTPIPALGHNRFLSVAMTTGGPDTADVFEEEIHPDHPRSYRYEDGWREMTVRQERIGIREGEKVRWVTVEIESTHHGPVVARKGNKAYALAISYADEFRLLEQIYAMMISRNLEEMQAALGMLQLMAQNVMVGTVDGHIYYVRNGRVPLRAPGFDYSRPVPGHLQAAEWKGIHPFSDLIQITNPPSGYMQNCNIAPGVMMKNSPLTRDRYQERPYLYNEGDRLHQRAAMVLELLDRQQELNLEEALEIALSPQVYRAEAWQARLKNLDPPAKPASQRLWKRILEWNGKSEAESMGALAFKYFKDALGEELAPLVDPEEAPPGALAPERLRQALDQAAERLLSDFGTLNVRYGDVFRVGRRGSLLDYPVAGGTLRSSGMATPRSIGFRARPDHTFLGEGGQTSVQVVVLTSPPRSFTLVPLGQSDHPDSPHWDDQLRDLFSPGRFKPTYFLDRDGLLREATARRRFDGVGVGR